MAMLEPERLSYVLTSYKKWAIIRVMKKKKIVDLMLSMVLFPIPPLWQKELKSYFYEIYRREEKKAGGIRASREQVE